MAPAITLKRIYHWVPSSINRTAAPESPPGSPISISNNTGKRAVAGIEATTWTIGCKRRDILRLISTNQVDLIEPLITSEEEGRITRRLFAERKNLYGAPAIAAALMAHPGVRDAAVLAYPDRLTGTGLYAFVEAREAHDLGEETLAAHLVDAVGRARPPPLPAELLRDLPPPEADAVRLLRERPVDPPRRAPPCARRFPFLCAIPNPCV